GDVPDPGELWEAVESRWGELGFESEWLGEKGRRDACVLVTGIAGYLADFARSRRRLLGAEKDFEVEVGRALLRGSMDRVELDDEGRIVVVDLKTGKRKPAETELREHAQL